MHLPHLATAVASLAMASFALPRASAQFRASLVADLEPGSGPSSAQTPLPTRFAITGSTAFFRLGSDLQVMDLASGKRRLALHGPAASDPVLAGSAALIRRGQAFWLTDGTTRNTLSVPIPPNRWADPIFHARGRAFFSMGDGRFGRTGELWVSDGTRAGTREIAKTRLSHSTTWGNRVIFRGADGEPWISDGTPAGTRRITDPNRLEAAHARDFTVIGNRALFVARNRHFGTELFATDGTTSGTHLVADIASGTQSSSPTQLGSIGNQVVFNARTNTELYISNGYNAGTRLLTRLPSPQSNQSIVRAMTPVGQRVFFTWDTAAHGRELWVCDGTAAGTRMVRDIRTGTEGSNPHHLFAHNGRVLFIAGDATHGRELWTSDGTATGTRILHEFGPGLTDGLVRIVGTYRGQVLLAAIDQNGSNKLELWITGGLPASTRRLLQDSPTEPNSAKYEEFVTTSDGKVFFAATNKAAGKELWVTDGTPNGTRLVIDLVPGSGSGYPSNLLPLRDRVVFTTPRHGLWLSDGTTGGTVRLSTLFPTNSQPVGVRFIHRDRLWMERTDPTHGRGFWETDGTRAGTRFVVALPGGKVDLVASIGNAVVAAVSTLTSSTLYRIDSGSPERLANVTVKQWFTWGDRLFFIHQPNLNSEIWVSDGTPDGTRPFHGFGGAANAQLRSFVVAADDRLFLGRTLHTDNIGIWVSDGTEVGSRKLKYEFETHPVQHGVAFGQNMLFAQDSPDYTWVPWIADGKTRATHRLYAGASGTRLEVHKNLRAAAPFDATHALIAGSTPQTGHELWVTDGTSAGTRLVQELAPGAASSSPEFVANLPSGSLFLATHPVHGRSLWRIDGLAGSRRIEAGCNGGASRTPQLSGTGSPVLGGRFALDLKHGARHAPGLLMVGEHPGSFPLGGYCRLVLDPNRIGATIPITTDHLGRTSIPFNIPANAWLHGRELRWQAAVSVRGTPNRLSLTNGLATALSAW